MCIQVVVHAEVVVHTEVAVHTMGKLYRHEGPYRVVYVFLFPVDVGLMYPLAIGWNLYVGSFHFIKRKKVA